MTARPVADVAERREQMARKRHERELTAPRRAQRRKRRVLIVVNPYASTVSDRLKNLVVYALQGRYEVEAVDTRSPMDAVRLSRDGADRGYDLMIAFGGDGTANEVVNGMVGKETPLTFLPGGSTNVMCRTLGIPNDIVDATEHVLALADNFRPRKIDLGRMDDRYFMFAAGLGIDAMAFQRVDRRPQLKARAGEYWFATQMLDTYLRKYMRNPHRMDVEADGRPCGLGYTIVVQNSSPITYFGSRAVTICEKASLTNGSLSLGMLNRLKLKDGPSISYRLMGFKSAVGAKFVDLVEGFQTATITTRDLDDQGAPRGFPIQVDGDYIGRRARVDFTAHPQALTIVA